MILSASDHAARALLRMRGWKSRRVATSAGRVHVLEARGKGSSGTLVLLHGMGSCGVHWLPVLGQLRRTVRRLVLPDALGHGFSDVPNRGMSSVTLRAALRESLDAVLDGEPATVVGNSMGGLGAIHYALDRPGSVAKLGLLSPGGHPMDEAALARFLEAFRMRRHTDALAFVDKVFVRTGAMRHLLAWGARRIFARPAMRSLLGSVRSEDLLSGEELRGLAMPVMLFWGGRDRLLPPEARHFFLRHLPEGARVIDAPHVGHSPQLEDPHLVARAIVELMGVPPRLDPHSVPTLPAPNRP